MAGLCRGEAKGALAMSAAGAGSEGVGSLACRAEQRGDGWVANGSLMWRTNGPEAETGIVCLRPAAEEAGLSGISRLPITLLFSRKVGELMCELSDNVAPKPSYRFYI